MRSKYQALPPILKFLCWFSLVVVVLGLVHIYLTTSATKGNVGTVVMFGLTIFGVFERSKIFRIMALVLSWGFAIILWLTLIRTYPRFGIGDFIAFFIQMSIYGVLIWVLNSQETKSYFGIKDERGGTR